MGNPRQVEGSVMSFHVIAMVSDREVMRVRHVGLRDKPMDCKPAEFAIITKEPELQVAFRPEATAKERIERTNQREIPDTAYFPLRLHLIQSPDSRSPVQVRLVFVIIS